MHELMTVSGGGIALVFGVIMEGLGFALSALYSVTHSYPIAIILVTVGVRALLLPLTIKSTRGMAAMQKAQPEVKKVQEKYRAMQRKARDRAEVQQIRMDMQREMNEVMRRHGASLGGGCLPQIAQFPVLIAMFSVMRAAIPVDVAPAIPVPAGTFDASAKRTPVCRPLDREGLETVPLRSLGTPIEINCPTPSGDKKFRIDTTKMVDAHTRKPVTDAWWISACSPALADDGTVEVFRCRSALGAGHLPIDSKLFSDVSADRATILGMHPGCTASGVSSKENARACTTDPRAGGTAKAIPYYLLIGLVVATSYFSGRQMNRRLQSQGTEVTQQQRMMQWMMPALFGFISLSLPAGTNFYYLFFNMWQIGQQHVQFSRQDQASTETQTPPKPAPDKPAREESAPERAPSPKPPTKPQGSKKKRKRKKR